MMTTMTTMTTMVTMMTMMTMMISWCNVGLCYDYPTRYHLRLRLVVILTIDSYASVIAALDALSR